MQKLLLIFLIVAFSLNDFISAEIDQVVASANSGRKKQEYQTPKWYAWKNTNFIWNFGLAISCDIMPLKNAAQYVNGRWPYDQPNQYLNIKSGDTVWLQCRSFVKFLNEALPSVKEPFVLVINDGDESFPSDILSHKQIEKILEDERIIAIFAQNCNYQGPSTKVHHIPIGIDFHSIAYGDGKWGIPRSSPQQQQKKLNSIISNLKPTNQRKKRAFVDFQLTDTMARRHNLGQQPENRTMIFNQIVKSGLIDYSKKPLNRNQLWTTKGDYAFSVSPHGNGLDCHRTWEDLALGCIVIVKTSSLDPLYEGLPVVIVSDWSEINSENFDIWLEKYGDVLNNPSYREKLTHAYWWSKIEAAAEPYKINVD